MKRRIIAIVLIIVGVAAMVFWEGWGRESILYDKVLVVNKDIQAGQMLTETDLIEQLVPRELLIQGSYTRDTFAELAGKMAKSYIPKNAQINESMVYIDDLFIGKNQSIYYIPSNWIASMSTSIRRGDTLEFYLEGGTKKIGEYKVAFAKSSDESEVITVGDDKSTLDRTGASGVATHIEIICTLDEYKNLYKIATGKDYSENEEQTGGYTYSSRFLLIQKF